jgi:hypothetical protein
MAAARAAMQAREQYLMRKISDSAARLQAAEKAYAEGDVQVASRIFMKVARGRPATPVSAQAKQRLLQLAEEAKGKLKAVDEQLASAGESFATSERLGMDGPLPGPWKEAVAVAFADYDKLCELYDAVPRMRGELKEHVAHQRRRPECAAVLNEPEALALVELAQQHEQNNHACCAYWVYKEAAQLNPAPTARAAAEQVARMEADRQIMAAAVACRQLQECHKLYNRAESLAKAWPSRSEELLSQVVATAPPDSEIYRAAKRRLQTLARD